MLAKARGTVETIVAFADDSVARLKAGAEIDEPAQLRSLKIVAHRTPNSSITIWLFAFHAGFFTWSNGPLRQPGSSRAPN